MICREQEIRRKINLFCIPFAGGSKYSFIEWEKANDNNLKAIALELPGRGARNKEPLLYDIHLMVDDLYWQICHLLHEPYVIFGHSLGGLLGYLLTRLIVRKNNNYPSHLFISGRRAPSIKGEDNNVHKLPKALFIEKVKSMGGCPEEIFCNEEILSFFEPIMRADFTAVDFYEYVPTTPLNIPITVFAGSEEDMPISHIEAWRQETISRFKCKIFPGNHFFIHQHREDLIRIISEKVLSAYQH